MKVLYVTCIPAPYKVRFLNKLSKLCELTVIFERRTASDRNRDWKVEDKCNFKQIYLKGLEYSNDASFSFGAIKHLMENKYDYIIFGVYHTATAIITMQYLKLKHINFILSSDGGFVKNDFNVVYMIKKYLIGMASCYLSPGGDTDKYLCHYGAKINKIHRYPFTSISKEDIKESIIKKQNKSQIKKKLGIKEKKIILSVGQFIPRKGFDLLLEAVKDLDSSYGIYIIGGNPPKEYIEIVERFCKQDHIHFYSFMSKEELDEYYLAADIFVFPTREDIWGLVVVEALSKGLPVITTNKCNAGLELIRDGYNGYIIESEDIRALINSIYKIFCNDISVMSENSIKSIEKYSYDIMAEEHYKVLLEMED